MEIDAPETVIPIPLRRDDIRFITLPRGEKGGGNEVGWNRDRNYAWNDPRLEDHLLNGGNYGLFPAEGSPLVILDIDDYAAAGRCGLIDGIDYQTFTILTAGTTVEKPKLHFYLETPEPLDGVYRLSKDGVKVGDLYCQHPGQARGYVVGPTCYNRHTGRFYTVTDLKPILRVGEWFAERIAELDTRPVKAMAIPRETITARTCGAKPEPGSQLLSDVLGLRVTDYLMPDKASPRGGEIEGAHPIHGSETGSNLTVSPDNIWYCRRHGTGGGPLEAYAVAEGLINCEDVRPGCLKPLWPEICRRLRRVYGPKVPGYNGYASKDGGGMKA